MMKNKVLMTGNEAIGEAALRAGCSFYAGYPITPQNELTAYLSRQMDKHGGVFIQAESELSAISMVLGAAAVGSRAMTSSSSPGISLKQEGISYLAGCELPCVIVNIMRGGPGLGNIAPSQSDYFQATKGGGHGDYHCIVLAPSSVQEAFDMMFSAFELADEYRNPVMLLGDGMLGQMMEPLIVHGPRSTVHRKKRNGLSTKKWALSGCKGRQPNIIKSFYMQEGKLEEFNIKLQKKYEEIKNRLQQWEGLFLDDAEVVLVAYGTMARIARSVVKRLRQEGKKIGLIRPITLWPFPKKAFTPFKKSSTNRRNAQASRADNLSKAKRFVVLEMSYGQMVEDVKLVLEGKAVVDFFGRSGGGMPTEEEIIKKVKL